MRTVSKLFLVAMTCVSLAMLTACPPKESDKPTAPAPTAEKPAAAPAPAAQKPEPSATEPGDGLVPMQPQAKITRLCVGPLEPAAASETTLVGKPWTVEGFKMTPKGSLFGEKITLGTISDTKEATPGNLASLAKIVAWYKEQGVQAILFAGDVAESQADAEKILTVLATAGVPVLVTMGNRDGMKALHAAIDAVNAKTPVIINMNIVRMVDFGALAVVSLPGYYDEGYIHNPDGCRYDRRDVLALKATIKDRKAATLLLSHGAPRGSGDKGIDWAVDGNVGDPEMVQLFTEAGVSFGVFGNVHEAGGYAVRADGKTRVKADKPSDQLLLNSGPADSLPWSLNDGTTSNGMAGVFVFEGGKALYRILRLNAG